MDKYGERASSRIPDLIKRSGVSVLSLSEQTGIARTTLIRRLVKPQEFRLDELEAIAAALKVSVSDLLTEDAA